MFQVNAKYLRVQHRGTIPRSIYLPDVDAPIINKGQNEKQKAYVPINGEIDLLLTDRVMTSFQQGVISKFMREGLIDAVVLDNPSVRITHVSTDVVTLTPADRYVLVDSSAGPVTVFLPLSAETQQNSLTIKRSSLDTNPIVILPQGGNTVDGTLPSYALLDPADWVELFPDRITAWWRSGEFNLGGGGGGTFFQEEFTIVNPSQLTYNLIQVPLPHSLVVFLNGVRLSPGSGRDYTLAGNLISLTAGYPIMTDDFISVTYSV
jgi:hypothetical protein